jgi:hypothetical protein
MGPLTKKRFFEQNALIVMICKSFGRGLDAQLSVTNFVIIMAGSNFHIIIVSVANQDLFGL